MLCVKSRILTIALALFTALAMMPLFTLQTAKAAVGYMPDVTKEMSKASYWSDKMKEPGKVLADASSISAIQQLLYNASGTNLTDLSKWSQETFNGVTAAANLAKGAKADATDSYNNYWCRYDDAGNYIGSLDQALNGYYKDMIDNCVDSNATTVMPVQYAICTKRTCITIFPSNKPLHDDPGDPDYDFRFLTMVRVNEPVVLMAKSGELVTENGKTKTYYQARTSSVSGWIDADDIAICKNKAEWLDAWNFSSDKTLVVYDDKIRTEESYFNEDASNRLLPMGTCLKLADESDWTSLINNRSAHNNHVVWMPVRKADGTYEKQLALIGENKKVSEGYLPLTSENIAMVAFNYLGDAYGWGGMMEANDCSGYVKDVYKCFGLDIARNTTWQALQPVKRYDLKSKSKEEKIEIIKKLPVGAVLIWPGHEMIYLGNEDEKLYVISSVSKVKLNGSTVRTRNVMINTLDMSGIGGSDWLTNLTVANVPYLQENGVLPERKSKEEPAPTPTPTPTPTPVPTLKTPVIGAKKSSAKQQVYLSWDEINDAGGYIVSYRKAGAKKWTQKRTGKAEYTVKKLKNKNLYQFRVAAKPANEKAKQSKYSSIKTCYIHSMPCKLKAGKKSLKVTWKSDKNSSGYQIRYSKKKSMKGAKTITIKNKNAKNKTIKKLKKKTKYYVQIRAIKKYKNKTYYGEYIKTIGKKTK